MQHARKQAAAAGGVISPPVNRSVAELGTASAGNTRMAELLSITFRRADIKDI